MILDEDNSNKDIFSWRSISLHCIIKKSAYVQAMSHKKGRINLFEWSKAVHEQIY